MPIATRQTPVVGPALTWGFGTAALLWTAWFLTHYPGLELPPAGSGSVLLALFVGTMFRFGQTAGIHAPRRAGALAGVVCASLNMLILGAYLVSESGEGRPSAAFAASGFLLGSALIGALASTAGAALRSAPPPTPSPPRTHEAWLARFSVVAVIAIVPLLLIGGIVTSTESGMAVPDWPRTYGANMFLYPIGLMTRPRIFEEHAHRLFGSLVGLTTMGLMIYGLIAGTSWRIKLYGVAMFVLVCVQGIMGGIRVTETSLFTAIIHGVTAQIFLACMVGFVVLLSPRSRRLGETARVGNPGKLKTLSVVLLVCLGIQLILGAGFRHLYGRGNPGAMHMIWTHAAFAVVVTSLALVVGFLAMRAKRDHPDHTPPYAAPGHALAGAIAIQVLLGLAALGAVLVAGSRGDVPESHELSEAPAVPIWESILTTAHQANGAFVLSMAALIFAWSWACTRSAAGPDRA